MPLIYCSSCTDILQSGASAQAYFAKALALCVSEIALPAGEKGVKQETSVYVQIVNDRSLFSVTSKYCANNQQLFDDFVMPCPPPTGGINGCVNSR